MRRICKANLAPCFTMPRTRLRGIVTALILTAIPVYTWVVHAVAIAGDVIGDCHGKFPPDVSPGFIRSTRRRRIDRRCRQSGDVRPASTRRTASRTPCIRRVCRAQLAPRPVPVLADHVQQPEMSRHRDGRGGDWERSVNQGDRRCASTPSTATNRRSIRAR